MTSALVTRLVLPVECKFLPRHGGLEHGATLSDGEYRHSLVVGAADRVRVLLATTRAGAGTLRTRRSTRCSRDRDRAHTGFKLKITIREFIECALVLEENNLTVRLATGLEANADLGHRRVADVFTLFVHVTRPVSGTDDQATLADCRE